MVQGVNILTSQLYFVIKELSWARVPEQLLKNSIQKNPCAKQPGWLFTEISVCKLQFIAKKLIPPT